MSGVPIGRLSRTEKLTVGVVPEGIQIIRDKCEAEIGIVEDSLHVLL